MRQIHITGDAIEDARAGVPVIVMDWPADGLMIGERVSLVVYRVGDHPAVIADVSEATLPDSDVILWRYVRFQLARPDAR